MNANKKTRPIKPRLIASADAARMLGVEPDTFRGRVARGLAPLPFARQGNLYYYKVADIEFFCDNGRWPDRMSWTDQPDGCGGSGSSAAAESSPAFPTSPTAG